MSNENSSFINYLRKCQIEKGTPYTHTRIGDKEHKISGGSYNIDNEKEFLDRNEIIVVLIVIAIRIMKRN